MLDWMLLSFLKSRKDPTHHVSPYTHSRIFHCDPRKTATTLQVSELPSPPKYPRIYQYIVNYTPIQDSLRSNLFKVGTRL